MYQTRNSYRYNNNLIFRYKNVSSIKVSVDIIIFVLLQYDQQTMFVVCYVKKGNLPTIAPQVSLVTHKVITSKVLFLMFYLAANIADKSLVVRHDDNSTYKKRNKNWNVPKIFFFANWSNPDVIWNLRQPITVTQQNIVQKGWWS